MYKELTIKNIKTFEEEQKLKIAPLTLLYGENSSGKTTLLKTFDIVHNIFAENEVKRGKNVSQKDSPFYRNENIQNISSKKIHYYSSKLNKKNIKIEIALDANFPTHTSDLEKYFTDIVKKNVSISSTIGIPTTYFTSDKDISIKKTEAFSVPLKILFNIKYYKKKKESKIETIEIKRSDNKSLVTFSRIDKIYKKITDPDEVGHKSEKFARMITRPDRYSSVYHRGRPIAEPDYFVDEELYSDYKIKTKENFVWKPYYESYLNIFKDKKEVIFRRKAMELFFKSIEKIKSLEFGYLKDSDFNCYGYHLLKFIFNEELGSQNLKNIKKEIEISENHINFFMINPKRNKKFEIWKKVTGQYKKTSEYISKKWLLDISKEFTKDLEIAQGLRGLSENDINTGKNYRDLLSKYKKKRFLFLESLYCAEIISNTPHINQILISNFLSHKKPYSFTNFTKFLKRETEEIFNVRFTKRAANVNWYLVRDGKRSSTTFGVFRYITEYINNGIGNVFYKAKDNIGPGFTPAYLFNPTQELLNKCSSEIKNVVNNLVICHPNKTDVSWSVPNEADYPKNFLEDLKKIASKDKNAKRILKEQDELTRKRHIINQKTNYDPHRINSNGSNFDTVISNNDSLRKELNKILKEVLNLELIVTTPKFLKQIIKDKDLYNAFRNAQRRGMMYPAGRGMYSKNKFIMLRDLKFKKSFFIHGEEVGKGPTNIIPFLAQILSNRPNLTYLVQELENNWHPKYQSKIIELIAKVIKRSLNKNFILETHSEIFVLQVQKLVQKGILKPSEVSINYISRNDKGNSEVHNIPLNDQGGFEKKWPGGFFTERMEVLTS
jgi:AAA15 family ATPase/GTPase